MTSDSKGGVSPVDNKKLMTSNFAEMDIKCNSSSIESNIISMCVVPVIQNQRKNFLRMQCLTIAVKGHLSKKTFRKNLEQLAEKQI